MYYCCVTSHFYYLPKGLYVRIVIDAIMESSRNGKWIRIGYPIKHSLSEVQYCKNIGSLKTTHG